jgi:hypothetical protein
MGVCCGKQNSSTIAKYQDPNVARAPEDPSNRSGNSMHDKSPNQPNKTVPDSELRIGQFLQEVPNEASKHDHPSQRQQFQKLSGAPGPTNTAVQTASISSFHYRGFSPELISSELDPIGDANMSMNLAGSPNLFSENESGIIDQQIPISADQSLAELGDQIGAKQIQTSISAPKNEAQLRITELERKTNKDERIYRYRARSLYELPDITSAFERYNEMVSMPNQKVEDSIKADLLDSNYLAEERTKMKNTLIVNANSQLKYTELPVWIPFQHTSKTYIFSLSSDFTDPYFEFSEKVLREGNLTSKKIRQYENPSIFHEDTMAEGIVFSERNLTSISAALSCLIHFDARLRTRLVKNLIYPQDVVELY